MAIARNDSLGMAVQGRLEGMADLVAEEAVYHHKCYCTLYDVPSRRNVSKIAMESKYFMYPYPYFIFRNLECLYIDSPKEKAFYKLCGWCDSEMESGVYTVSQYGNSIFITNQEHRKDVVCFRNCTADIIRDYHKKMETGIEDEKKKAIIKMAASLIISVLTSAKRNFPRS